MKAIVFLMCLSLGSAAWAQAKPEAQRALKKDPRAPNAKLPGTAQNRALEKTQAREQRQYDSVAKTMRKRHDAAPNSRRNAR